MSNPAVAAEKTGLFLATYDITNGMLGAQDFRLVITVNTVDKFLTGSGRITQAVNPPLDIRTHLLGNYTYMTVMPSKTSILVVASGNPVINWPAGVGIGPVLPQNVELRMVLSDDWKSGTANYRYLDGDGTWHEVNNVPVKLVNNQ